MEDFENQPTTLTPESRKQRTRSFSEESSSEISSHVDLQERLRRERTSRKETDEVYQRLQEEYDELLKKYAQAENTIDQLKIGAKLNLYSDLPPPQESSFVNVTVHKQPGVFRFPRSNQAVLSNSDVLERGSPSGGDNTLQNGRRRTATTDSYVSYNLTPDGRAENLRPALSSKVQQFQEDVDALQEHVMEGQWVEPELRELRSICQELRLQNENLKRELDCVRKWEGNDDESFTGDFLPEDSLEGQLYRCSLRLEEISDQLGESILHCRTEDHSAKNNSYSELLDRPRDSHHTIKELVKGTRPDSDLQKLMQRLRNIKDASKNNESGDDDSSEDVEDLDLNSIGQNDEYSRRFSLGPLPDSDGEQKQNPAMEFLSLEDSFDGSMEEFYLVPLNRLEYAGLGDLAGPVELQESGYFASESMSVTNDPASEPLSNQYFANSEGPHNRSRGGSLVQSSPYRPSVSPLGTVPVGQRSRTASQRSHANTADVDSLPEDDEQNDMPSSGLPSPHTSPEGPKYPQASSSPRRDDRSEIHPPRRQNSRVSEAGSRRSRASSNASRLPADSLRDLGNRPDQDNSFVSSERERNASTKSTPRETHVPQEPRASFASGGRSSSARNIADNPVGMLSGDAKKPSKATPARRPLRGSFSGDSRVSTPLFLPNADTVARPNGVHARGKHGLVPVETERGFDSGFFGSEGSRISRGHESPDIPPHYNFPEAKLRGAPLQEQSETETDGERLSTAAPKMHPKLISRSREPRRRRSYLQSLSESEEDRELEAAPSKASVRTPSSQRERRSHRHTPTHPATRSDSESVRRLDDGLRRHMSSPNLLDPVAGERSRHSPAGARGSRSPLRHDTPSAAQRTGGPRSEQGRPMDKQSVRSYPGDRDSVRSGRRSRRGEESSSGYSDNERKYRRDPVDKLREELQRLRDQLQQETNTRGLQAQMYDDLRRRHDDLEREMARRGTEQQMASMYDNLQKQYDALANEISRGRENGTSPSLSLYEDLRKRLDELANEVEKIKLKENERPLLSPAPAPTAPVSTVRFLCPLCGGSGIHSHGEYYYPGYAGPRDPSPVATPGGPPSRHHTETQTPYSPKITNTFIGHPTTPAATSTPYYPNVVASPQHHHTHTYPGAVTYPTVAATSPLRVHPGAVTDNPTIHHIHHLPGSRHRSRREQRNTDSQESDSDDGYPPHASSTRRVRLRKSPVNRNSWGSHYDDELESYRLHQSLDDANRAARRMQRLSKKMLGSIASDLIRSGRR